MGCDIHGPVEVKILGSWKKKKDARDILKRDYDLFGLLFGVRNYANFAPLFAAKGLPSDSPTKNYSDINIFHSHTWASYHEIKNIDLQGESRGLDTRIREYEIQEDSTEKMVCKFSSSSVLSREEEKIVKNGGIVKSKQRPNVIYRCEKMLVNEVLKKSCFYTLVNFMDSLANSHGKDNVRLVVWFCD